MCVFLFLFLFSFAIIMKAYVVLPSLLTWINILTRFWDRSVKRKHVMGGQISSQNGTGNWRWGLIKGYVDFYPFLSACVSSLFSFALLAFRPDYAFIFFYFLSLFSTAKFCSGSVRATCYFASLIDDTPGDGKSDWFPWLISFGFFFFTGMFVLLGWEYTVYHSPFIYFQLWHDVLPLV